MMANSRCPSKLLRLVAAVAVVTLGTSGCQYLADQMTALGLPMQDRAVTVVPPQPKVETAEYRHNVEFGITGTTLSSAEGQGLYGFLQQQGIGSGDRVYLSASDMGSTFTERRLNAVRSFLAINHVDSIDVPADVQTVTVSPDQVAVVVRRYVAVLPPCPNWTSLPGDNFDNQPGRNFGCATAVNLGMMVARPVDLMQGDSFGPFSGQVMARAARRYNRGETINLIRDAASAEEFPTVEGDSAPAGDE